MAISPLERFIAELPVFDGFPYLLIRVVPAMYHVTLLPEDASERTLVDIARSQWRANLLDVCLVIGPERALYTVEALTASRRRGAAISVSPSAPSVTLISSIPDILEPAPPTPVGTRVACLLTP